MKLRKEGVFVKIIEFSYLIQYNLCMFHTRHQAYEKDFLTYILKKFKINLANYIDFRKKRLLKMKKMLIWRLKNCLFGD